MLLKSFNFFERQLVAFPKVLADDLMDASSDKAYFAGTNQSLSRLAYDLDAVSNNAEHIAEYLTMGYTDLTVFERSFSISDDGTMTELNKDYSAYFIIFKRKNRYFEIFQKACPQKLDSLIGQYLAKSDYSEALKNEIVGLLQQIKKEVNADDLTVIGFREVERYFWH